jgi:hypothetical protein
VALLTASAAHLVNPPQDPGSCRGPAAGVSGWTHFEVIGTAKLT